MKGTPRRLFGFGEFFYQYHTLVKTVDLRAWWFSFSHDFHHLSALTGFTIFFETGEIQSPDIVAFTDVICLFYKIVMSEAEFGLVVQKFKLKRYPRAYPLFMTFYTFPFHKMRSTVLIFILLNAPEANRNVVTLPTEPT